MVSFSTSYIHYLEINLNKEPQMKTYVNCSPVLIGLAGQAKAGKTVISSFIRDYFASKHEFNNNQVQNAAFADPIRVIGTVFGFSWEELNDQDKKEQVNEFWGITPRKFMQLVGSEMFRNHLDPECWVKLCLKKYHDLFELSKKSIDIHQIGNILRTSRSDNTVVMHALNMPDLEEGDEYIKIPTGIMTIGDVRFPNEVQGIHDAGGIVIRIDRPALSVGNDEWRNHESEKFTKELKVDEIFLNDEVSDVDTELKKSVWKFMDEVCERTLKCNKFKCIGG